ncbi:type II toxin-antitoxin system RelE/ParE family toxin [uncultured Zhongshania sp.]|uniref:type II toxin-antitoxin system RelE/ParE family toxin n=1 Tax=Zhongshania sp. TaxID=1971902 RepID=UPI001B768538|nr:type II toxin-antitoxin system RelE/ParE family toxin [Zhongshania sp.]
MIYKLTNKAASDYARLYQYGIENFGYERADSYAEGMEKQFQAIGENPLRYPAVDQYFDGCRRSVYYVHSIYYRQCTDCVEIVRILSREDISRGLR